MSNPWLKKNPFMSMWLSAANRAASTVRGHATAEMKRQAKTAAATITRETIKAGSAALKPPAAKKTRKR